MINGTTFVLLIVIIALCIVLYSKIEYHKNRYKKLEESTITALQEIACDYKIKVINVVMEVFICHHRKLI